jgi:hypothetical protein
MEKMGELLESKLAILVTKEDMKHLNTEILDLKEDNSRLKAEATGG